jgi:tetratricopeptide (TPR) repeat protein
MLRLVERGRVWEVELPESTGGYEVRIPLGPGIETPTEADQEMLGKTPPAGRSKSYLATLAKVGEMYSSHRYELALIEVVDLEQQYPKDPRLLAMKGSLYQKLGKTALAREAWKKALEIDPSDTTIAEALRALKEE